MVVLGVMHLLEIENLQISFRVFEGIAQVIQGVNLTIDEGETVALVGESGCGKSSIAHAVLGILPPQARVAEGKIRFQRKDILAMKDEERHLWVGRKIASVPQYPMTSLTHAFKIGDQMSDRIRYAGTSKAPLSGYFSRISSESKTRDEKARRKAEQMLEKVQIPSPENVMDSYSFQLSGGMIQRVLIAMALSVDPVMLIADEITSALDVTIQDTINTLLLDLIRETGLSLLYITHDLGIARLVSDIVYIMYAGCIVETGKTRTVFETPIHPYTQGLIGAIPKLTGVEFQGIDGRLPSYTNPPEGCRFHTRCKFAASVCRARKPELVGKNGHLAACHLHN